MLLPLPNDDGAKAPQGFTAPDGTFYQWNKPTPPTQADIDAIVQFHTRTHPARRGGPIDPYAAGGGIGVRPAGLGGPSGNGDPLGDPADTHEPVIRDPAQPSQAQQQKRYQAGQDFLHSIQGLGAPKPQPKTTYDLQADPRGDALNQITNPKAYTQWQKELANAKMRDKQAADATRKQLYNAPLTPHDFDGLPYDMNAYITALNSNNVVQHRDGKGFTELAAAQKELGDKTLKYGTAGKMTRSQSDVEGDQERQEAIGHAQRAQNSMVGHFIAAQRDGNPAAAMVAIQSHLIGRGVDRLYESAGTAADTLTNHQLQSILDNATTKDGAKLTPGDKSKIMALYGQVAANVVGSAAMIGETAVTRGVGGIWKGIKGAEDGGELFTHANASTKAAEQFVNRTFQADGAARGLKNSTIALDTTRPDDERLEAAAGVAGDAVMFGGPHILGKILERLPQRTVAAAYDAVHGLIAGSRDPAEAVARATAHWGLNPKEAQSLVDSILSQGHAGPKSALRAVDSLNEGQYGELLSRLPQDVQDVVHGQLAGGDSEGARQTIAQHLNSNPITHEQRFEGGLSKAVKAGILDDDQALDIADRWGKVADAWSARTGHSREDFYERHAPKVAIDQALPEDSQEILHQYQGKKLGPDMELASVDDLHQFLQGRGEMPVHFTIADRAVNGLYHNPETGATVRLHGGPGFGLDDERYAVGAWANEGANAARQIEKGATQSGGLVLPYTASMDTVRGSMHGPMALKAEGEAAIGSGAATHSQVLDLVNDALDKMGKPRVADLDELLRNTRDFSFEDRKDFMKKALHKRQDVLPDWETVQNLMTDPRLRGGETGDVASALYVDPKMKARLASELGLPEHPGYERVLSGLNLGATSPVNLRDLFRDDFEAMRLKIAHNKGVDPSRISDGEVYPKWKYGFDRRGGNGTLTAEQLASLADDGSAARPRLGRGAEGRLADDDAGAAGALLQDEPRAAGQGGTLHQRSAADGGVSKGAVVFTDGEKPVVHLFTGVSDVSTVLHESAHIWRRTLSAEDQLILQEAFGAKIGSVKFEERFARGVERYMADGTAPTEKSQPLFDRFKTWLSEIYKKVEGSEIGEAVDPKIRDVFDRMFGESRPVEPEPVPPTKRTRGKGKKGTSAPAPDSFEQRTRAAVADAPPDVQAQVEAHLAAGEMSNADAAARAHEATKAPVPAPTPAEPTQAPEQAAAPAPPAAPAEAPDVPADVDPGKLVIGNANAMLEKMGEKPLTTTPQSWGEVEAKAQQLDQQILGDTSGIRKRAQITGNDTISPEERLVLHAKAQQLLEERQAIDAQIQGAASTDDVRALQFRRDGLDAELKDSLGVLYKSGSQDGRNLAFHRYTLQGEMTDPALLERANRITRGRLTKEQEAGLLEANKAVRDAQSVVDEAAAARAEASQKVASAAANGELRRVSFSREELEACPLFKRLS